MQVAYCIDCKYSTCWRSGEDARKYGKGLECSRHILNCPNDHDFCSKGEPVIKCKGCGCRFDYDDLPNFCPNCGTRMKSEINIELK